MSFRGAIVFVFFGAFGAVISMSARGESVDALPLTPKTENIAPKGSGNGVEDIFGDFKIVGEEEEDELEDALPTSGLFVDYNISIEGYPFFAGTPPAEDETPLKYEVIADISHVPEQYRIIGERLKSIVERPELDGIKVGVHVETVDGGRVVFSYNGNLPMNPASNAKLITSAAALSLLGPAYRFNTEIYFDRPPGSDGVVNGNIYVKGYGDPSLVSERVWLLVTELKNRGVTKITGDLIVDESYFAGDKRNPAWKKEPHSSQPYLAPYGAFSVNFNAVAVSVFPAMRAGQKPRVQVEAYTPYFIVDNRAITVDGRRTRIIISTEAQGKNTKVIVSGRVNRRFSGMMDYRIIHHPELYAGYTLADFLKNKGIAFRGKVKTGIVPEKADKFHTFRSPPLADILKRVNKNSSNFTAEQLLKVLGARVYEPPGDWEKGLKVLREFLAIAGLYPEEYALYNGSGLSLDSRISPAGFTKLLNYMYHQDNIKPEYLSSLPIAGQDGTLSSRMGSVPLGAIRAKTGSLDNVSALSGYAASAEGEVFSFSIMLNKQVGSKIDSRISYPLMDNIAEALSLPQIRRPTSEDSRPVAGTM